jgi:hypothetical protein
MMMRAPGFAIGLSLCFAFRDLQLFHKLSQVASPKISTHF